MQHESHTPRPEGLARSDSGKFVLTEIKVRINDEAHSIERGAASYEQGNFPVSNAFDDNAQTGWAVHRGKPVVNPEHAMFSLAAPVAVLPGTTIEIRLRFDSRYAHHNMGRFLISAYPKPILLSGESDPGLLVALNTAATKRTKDQNTLIVEAQRKASPAYQQALKKRDGLKKRLEQANAAIPRVMVMEDMENPRPTYILARGL